MLIASLVVFIASIVGMGYILVRRIVVIKHAATNGEDVSLENIGTSSVARVQVGRVVDRVEMWLHWNAREEALKLLDRILKIFERGAGKIAGETKQARLFIQERFRVIPRESAYWRQIHTWKKSNGKDAQRTKSPTEEDDTSNHP